MGEGEINKSAVWTFMLNEVCWCFPLFHCLVRFVRIPLLKGSLVPTIIGKAMTMG